MTTPTLRLASCACLVLLLACGQSGAAFADGENAPRPRRSALTVLDGERLQTAVESGATLIQILSTRVPSVRMLAQGVAMDQCPRFVIRGNSSIQNVTTPDIYINDTRAQDTCVLNSLTPQDIGAIEVYSGTSAPAGMATRANTGGMIVLRTRMR